MQCYVLLYFLSLYSLYLVAEGDFRDVEVFIAKKIITLDQYESETEAVAVSGEIILSTGSLQDLSEKFPSAKVSKEFENAFIGAEITLVIGIITDVDILFIPLITYKSDFEKKTKRKESVTIDIIVKFFTKVEI